MSNKKQMPAFLALTIICVVAALALAVTNSFTKGPIQEHAMKAQREAFGAVMTADEYVEMTIPEGSGVSALVEAKQNGETIGYCVAASQSGYAGPVAVTLGIGTDGKVTGAKIGDTSFAETSGFGSRWLAENQVEQFIGIDLKEGGAIEALSGATVTSTAVLNASNTAMAAVADVLGIERTEPVLVFGVAEKKPVEQMALTGDIHEGSAKGFASDVKVQLTVDANGAITGLAIESSGETAGFGTRCMEDPTFAEQFVGKTAPFAIGENIDALSGATVTSTAVVAAVNAAVEAPANPDAVPFGAETAEEASAEALPEGAKVASAPGFMGADVGVTVTFNEDGTIATIAIDNSKQVPPVCDMVNDDAFLAQFIGKAGPFTADVVTGATFTSQGVIDALNSLYAAPAVPAGTAYEAAAKGFQSDVKVTVYADEAGVITGIVVDSTGETQGFGTRCGEDETFLNQFVGKTAPVEADVLTGATVTSKAVIEAVNAALPAAAAEEAPVEEVAPAVEETPVATTELTGTAKGFQSDVTVTLTVDENNVITGIAVDSTGETQGFGTRCGEDEAFLNQFIGKTAPVEADALSGATVTSKAVIEAVNAALPAAAVEEAPVEEVAPAVEEAPAATTELTGTAKGFQSDVTVTLTVDENNVITGIAVDSTGETQGFGTRCGEDEAFLNQFIGKKATPDVGEGIDALTGATVTSNAVVEAANVAIGVAVAVVETEEEAPVEEVAPAVEEAPVATTELTGTAKGFQSDVTVTLTVDENNVITGIVVDSTGETQGFGTRCGEDETFLNQFIGKTAPVAVDALTGATVTSNAVVEAVNSVFPTQDMSTGTEEAPVATELTGTAKGFQSDVTVTLTVDANNVITGIAVDSTGETQGFGTRCGEDEAFLNQFIGKTAPVEVDVLTGATVTSKAVIEAVNNAK